MAIQNTKLDFKQCMDIGQTCTVLLWLVNKNGGGGLIRPRLVYEWQNNVKTWLGADIFYGYRDGLFGQFSDNGRIVIGVELGY